MTENIGGIYAIVNRANGKRYIGSTCNFVNREATHWAELKGGYHGNPYLQKSVNKHGIDSFDFVPLQELPTDYLMPTEQQYMDMLKPEYNIAKFANKPPTRAYVPPEMRKEYFTTEEAGEELGLKVGQIRRFIRRGMLDAIIWDYKYLVSKEDVADFAIMRAKEKSIPEGYMTHNEAAEELGMCAEVVLRLIREGRLDTIKRLRSQGRGQYLISKEDVADYAMSKTIPAGHMTTKEAAEELGVSVKSVCTYINKGKLDAIKRGKGKGRYFVPKESVAEYATIGGTN